MIKFTVTSRIIFVALTLWLVSLKYLELRRTKVTDEGMARLKKKKPALKYYLFKR